MKALDRLRALEFGERVPDQALTKPPKPPFVSFVGTGEAHSRNISSGETLENKGSELERSDDPGTERRRAKALAMLEANPSSRIAAVAEVCDPVIVGVAIRGVAYEEIEIPAAGYDPFAILAMLERYNGDASLTMH